MEDIKQKSIGFAESMLTYYGNMKKEFNTTSLENLHKRTKQFLQIIEKDHNEKSAISTLLAEMEIERSSEGTGYNQLYFHIKEFEESFV